MKTILTLAILTSAFAATKGYSDCREERQETHRLYHSGDQFKLYSSKVEEASCGISQGGYFVGLKDGESYSNLKTIGFGKYTKNWNCKWVGPTMSHPTGHHEQEFSEWADRYDWNDHTEAYYVKPGCSLKISEKEGFAGNSEVILPPDEDKSLWAPDADFTKLIRIDSVAKKSRLHNKIAAVSCACGGVVETPVKLDPSERKKAEDGISAHKAVFEKEFSSHRDTFQEAEKIYNNLVANWDKIYAANYQSFFNGLKYSDVTIDVPAQELLDSHNKLLPVYKQACPAFKYQEAFAFYNDEGTSLRTFRDKSRVFLAGWASELGYFGNTFSPVAKSILDLEKNPNKYLIRLSKIQSNCDTWSKVIQSIPQRIRYEKSRAVIAEYTKISAEIQAALDQSVAALGAYQAKTTWTWNVQEKIKVTRKALQTFHYEDAAAAILSMQEFWGTQYVDIDENVTLSSEEKTAIQNDLLSRIEKVNKDWIELTTKLGIKGIVLARVQNEFNTGLLKSSRAIIAKHVNKDVKYEELKTQLTAAGFKVKAECTTLAQAVANKDCWVLSLSSDLSDNEYLSIDKQLNPLSGFLSQVAN